MQTSFSPAQLADPETAHAEGIAMLRAWIAGMAPTDGSVKAIRN